MDCDQDREIHLIRWNPGAGFRDRLVRAFYRHRDGADTRRSHFFQGRFENITIPEHRLPGMSKLIEVACTTAAGILACRPRVLGCGYWFNCMAPGQLTLAHSHDEDRERLCAVYYLRVPPHSGDLLIHRDRGMTRIVPVAGLFVYFHPTLRHEVTENRGGSDRLSVAMNFGPVCDRLSGRDDRTSAGPCRPRVPGALGVSSGCGPDTGGSGIGGVRGDRYGKDGRHEDRREGDV